MRVENLTSNSHAVQLLGRTWRIVDTDANGEPVGDVQDVHAPTTGAGMMCSVCACGLPFVAILSQFDTSSFAFVTQSVTCQYCYPAMSLNT